MTFTTAGALFAGILLSLLREVSVEQGRHPGRDVSLNPQQYPLLEREFVQVLRQHLDFEKQVAAKFGFAG